MAPESNTEWGVMQLGWRWEEDEDLQSPTVRRLHFSINFRLTIF